MRVMCDACQGQGTACESCGAWVRDDEPMCPACEAARAVDVIADQLRGTLAALAAVRLVIDGRTR